MNRIQRLGSGLLLLIGLIGGYPVMAAERVALVIGNSAYAHAAHLNNPPRDAQAIARALTGLGFQVTGPLLNQSKAQMDAALRQFGRQAHGATAAVVYFSGHGVEVRGQNYLLPTDAVLERERDVSLEAVGLEVVLDQIGGARDYRLVILDACRDNPLAHTMRRSDGTRSAFRGLAPVEPSGQTYIAYAARAGQRAKDGPAGAHSPYAAALLKYLPQPGLPLERLFGSVREEVLRTTTRTQEPALYGTFGAEPIYLAGLKPDPVVVDHDLIAWQSAENCGTAACYRAYLKTHPQGRYAEMARARLEPAAGSAPTAPVAEPTCCRLWVKATPADAQVRIMSIVPAYQDGMVVARGRHRIRVERSGYEPYDQWVEVNQAEQVVMVDLQPSAATAPAVAPAPRPSAPATRQPFEPEMVRLPGGCFMMGSPASEAGRSSNERQHRVCLEAFEIGKYEVTQGEWQAVMGNNPSHFQHGDRHPVEGVSWDDVQKYLQRLNQRTGQTYRLPTEAEWEYACRGGVEGQRYCGGDDADRVAWHLQNSSRQTHPVGRKAANDFGLYDMSGNVWEWTCSLYNFDYNGAETRCISPYYNYTNLSLRGGSWTFLPARVRAALRSGFKPTSRNYSTGFRLARSL